MLGLLTALVLAVIATSPAGAAPGDVDSLNANIIGNDVYVAVAQPDGKTIIAGDFTSVLGVARRSIARLNADGTLDMTFNPNPSANSTVFSVAVQADGKVLLGGSFTTLQPNGAASATARNRVARVNGDGTLDPSFDPRANNSVNSLAVQVDGKVLIGGGFTTLQPNGVTSATTRNRIARVNADGTLDASFDPNLNSNVLSVTVQADGKILLGGGFTTLQPNGAAAATARQYIARVNADGTLDMGFDPKPNISVFGVAVQADGKVLLGGAFVGLQPNGAAAATARRYIARVNPDGTLDTGFDPKANNFVRSMAVQADGKVLVVGEFDTLQPNGATAATERWRIARLNVDGTVAMGFDPVSFSDVHSVAVRADGKVLLGGEFDTLWPTGAVFPATRRAFAQLDNDPATQMLTAPDTGQVLWSRGGAAPEVSQVTFEQSTDGGANWTSLGAGTRVGSTADWLLTGLTLPTAGTLRARGRTTSGINNGSSGLLEQVAAYTAPAPSAPNVRTNAASTVTTTGATLNATVSANGAATGVTFEYSTDSALGSGVKTTAPPQNLATTVSGAVVSTAIPGLAPHTTYYFRARGANLFGTSNGSVLEFTTANTAPTAPNVTATGTTGDQKTVTIAFSAKDADDDTVAIIAAEGAAHLSVDSFTGTSVTFTPAAAYAGVATFTFTLGDGFGGMATGTVMVTISDNDAPALMPPADLVREATNSAGALVTYPNAAATDVVGVTSLTYSQASGTRFPIGMTTVAVTARDEAMNTTQVSFTVTVQDTTPPVVTPPANVAVEATSGAGALVAYPGAAVGDAVGVVSVQYSQASGTLFPSGVTTVTATARDAANNLGAGTFTVTVRDTTAPVVSGVPPNITAEATSAAGAVVSYPAGSVTDAVGVTALTYSQNSGTTFPLGTTTVTITARDAADNAGTGTFTVTVRDTTAPMVTAQANVTVEATGAAGAVVNYPAGSATDAVGVTSLTYSQNSGTTFPLGTTTVTITARDAANNTGTGTFTVTVSDSTAPVVTPPVHVIVEATSAAGAVVTYPAATATDDVAVTSLSYSQSSGTTFPLGTTTVTVTAGDEAMNTTQSSFTVTVQDTTAPVASVPAVLQVAAGPDGTVALGDLRSNVTRSDGATATENLTVTQTPPAATVLGLGSHAVSFTVTDAAGNFITVATTVGVSFDRAQSPGKVTVAAQSGAPAPAAVGLPADAVLATFGAPAVSDFRELAARVGMNSGKKRIAGIYFVDGAGAEELAAFAGGPAPGADGQPLAGAMFKSFLDPVLAPGGALAFAGTLSGPKKAVDQGVWTDAFGPLALVLREGAPVPGLQGELLKSITSLSLRDAGLLARVQLASGATAQSKVTPKNATALVLLTAAQTGQVLLRTGTPLDGVSGSLITSLSVLQPAPGSPGHGRWQGTGAVVAKVTLATGETRVVKLAPDGTATKLLSTADSPELTLAILSPVAQWKSFGLPALDSAGQSQAVAAALVRKVGGVTANDDTLLLWSADGIGWTGVGRKGGATPIATPAGVRYASFFDPVANDGGRVAFLATLQGAGVTPKNRTALFSGLGNDPRLIARLGDAAPDGGGNATGARWSKFISHALPGGPGGGIVFLAETTGGDLPKSRLGLWAADSTGQLRRLLRTGAPVVPGGQLLTGLALLNAPPGSYGTARSYNETGSLAVQATFADKTQALLRLDLP